MNFAAKHNVVKHTVTVHAVNCSCVATGSVWVIEADDAKAAVEVAKEDAPNVKTFKIAPCAKV